MDNDLTFIVCFFFFFVCFWRCALSRLAVQSHTPPGQQQLTMSLFYYARGNYRVHLIALHASSLGGVALVFGPDSCHNFFILY